MISARWLVLVSALLIASSTALLADVIVVAPTATTTGMLQITAPITFRISTGSTLPYFVLDEWVLSDGTQTSASLSPNLVYTRNTTTYSSVAMLADNSAQIKGDLTPNDGLLGPINILVFPLYVLTLQPGTYTIDATANFNQQATQTFTGNMFVADFFSGDRISNVVSAAPEPTTWALLGVGAAGAGMVMRRRRGTVA